MTNTFYHNLIDSLSCLKKFELDYSNNHQPYFSLWKYMYLYMILYICLSSLSTSSLSSCLLGNFSDYLKKKDDPHSNRSNYSNSIDFKTALSMEIDRKLFDLEYSNNFQTGGFV